MKIKTAIAIIIVLFFQQVQAQKKQISLDLARSFNGTGDMRGLGFAVEYGKYLKNKVELTAAIGANIHHSQLKILTYSPGQPATDGSVMFMTAGAQLTSQIHLAIIQTNAHEFKLGVGALAKYQASSYPDMYSIYTPAQTGIPEVTVSFRHLEKQEIITAGYIASVSYCFTFRNNLFIGAKVSLQNDTNADIITQYGLRVGKRL